jgi:hypothetical protein
VAKTVDMKALVAYLTGTSADSWEPFMGRKEGIGIEQAFTEVGDGFGPYDEDVADMIRDGYTSGQRWKLDTAIDLEKDDDARHEIARLISGGYTSGYGPTWSVEMDKIMPGEAYVQIDDEFVTVRMEGTAKHDAIDFQTTIGELEDNPETARLVQDLEQTPGM